jgi:hypothetical protein
MDAFSPPLERHLDNLAKTVTAVLANPSLPKPVDIDAPVTPVGQRGPVADDSPAHIPSRSRGLPPYKDKVLMAIIATGFFLILGAATWYLGHKRGAA